VAAQTAAQQPAAPTGGAGDKYIVVLRGNGAGARGTPGALQAQAAVEATARDHAARYGLRAGHIYAHALRGYSAQVPAAALARLRADPSVLFVGEDREVRISAQELPTGVDRIDGEKSSRRDASPASWGNLSVAVIDTGSGPHPDLNVVGGVDCVASPPGPFDDQNGHGTHVAGTVGALNNDLGVVGVAPGVPIYSVRVLNANGVGSTDTVICGIDWVTANAAAFGIKVANMSLGQTGADDGNCGRTNLDPLHQAICGSIAGAGVIYVVAAGNGNLVGIGQNLAGSTPAAYDEVLTVTAMADANGKPFGGGTFDPSNSLFCDRNPLFGYVEKDEAPASFSNYATAGSADANHVIAAPGVCIRSTVPTGPCSIIQLQICDPSGYYKVSGTSMASPHVAGTAAVCIAAGPCAGMNPAQIIQKLRGDAAALNQAFPAYGFYGDPARQLGNRYYGYLLRAGGY
jgi:subtilisin family serine protease